MVVIKLRLLFFFCPITFEQKELIDDLKSEPFLNYHARKLGRISRERASRIGASPKKSLEGSPGMVLKEGKKQAFIKHPLRFMSVF